MESKKETQRQSSWDINLFGVAIRDLSKLLPRVIAVSVLAWISIWISEFIGLQLLGFEKSPVSPVMLAIILGLLIGGSFRYHRGLSLVYTFT